MYLPAPVYVVAFTYLSKIIMQDSQIVDVGKEACACLRLSCKYFEVQTPSLFKLDARKARSEKLRETRRIERQVLTKLDYQLYVKESIYNKRKRSLKRNFGLAVLTQYFDTMNGQGAHASCL